jgi:hypothetical protein
MNLLRRYVEGRRSQATLGEYLSSGSSAVQLAKLIEVIDTMAESAEIDSAEYRYLQAEVLPMLSTLFRAAVDSRRRLFSDLRLIRAIGFVVAIVGAASATEAVPPEKKWVPLLFVSIALALQGVIQANNRQRQPALDWFSAREAFDYCLGEVVDRITGANDYADLDQRGRFLLMASRIKASLDKSEKRIIEQIKSFLESSPGDACANKESQKDSDTNNNEE